jgi:diguanylate cyclase (GGDEF)-like protein
MPGDYFYYIEANLVCVIIFSVMLGHDLLHKDRAEKQLKFDHALSAFLLYFITDALWAAVEDGIIPKNYFTFAFTNLANFVVMAAITYMWLRYVLAVEQVPDREKPIKKIAIAFPLVVSSLLLIILFIVAPHTVMKGNYELRPIYYVMMCLVAYIYVVAIMIYTIKRAMQTKNRIARRKHLIIGFFPLVVIFGGLLQMAAPKVPILCFSCTILMLTFYIQSLESQISIDPLTGINNRGQLIKYLNQYVSTQKAEEQSYVVMIDVNDFKLINDTHGHAEGDRALILIADLLKKVIGISGIPAFLGRYGGDEFIIVARTNNEEEIQSLIKLIREELANRCKEEKIPYTLTLSIGYDKLIPGKNTFQICMQRADERMYQDKKRIKKQRHSTATV